MRQVSATARNVLSIVTAVALIAMMLHTIVHALARHLFDAPLSGTNELVAYWYMPFITLVGFVTALWRGEHIAVSLVTDRLRDRNKREFRMFGYAVSAILCLGFCWFGLLEALENMEIGATAGVTTIPMWPVTFLVPVTFGALAMFYVRGVFAPASLAPQDDVAEETSPSDGKVAL